MNQTIVIDNGSGEIKAGFAGEDHPKVKISTLVGRSKEKQKGMATNEVFVGKEIVKKVVEVNYPIEQGIITNFDDMEKIWHHTFFNELRIDPSDCMVIVTEAPLNPKANRERMTQIMFEIFNFEAFYVAISAVLSLYSSGRTTGIVLDTGYDVTHSVPIYEGYALPHAFLSSSVAGRDVTDYLKKLLIEKFIELSDEQVNEIKKQCCFLSEDFEQELEKESGEHEVSFKLSDETQVEVGSEKFKCPEILFKPSLIGKEESGVHMLVYKSIMRCDEMRSDLYKNIFLAGGSSMFPGFQERLLKEITALAPQSLSPKVIATQGREESAWIGGSILASLSTFEEMWITKINYDEAGPTIVHRMCF